jgi:hypothetical protein
MGVLNRQLSVAFHGLTIETGQHSLALVILLLPYPALLVLSVMTSQAAGLYPS